ncbi:MAG: BTAD domain-containing putative transcriptional regulator, partial [Acidimicrobiia bacterium]
MGGPKQRAVLALLIANAGRSVSTGTLIEGVYGDHPPQGARRSIQTYVSNLRGELGDVIKGTNDGYELAVERDRVDALVFEDAVSGSRDREPSEASTLLRDALGLWRGHPYADVDAGHAIDFEIRRLDEMRMQALEARIDADLTSGYHRDLIAELESLTVEYPLRERFTHQQMVALYRSGRQAEALRAYERTRTYLVNEMGLDPSSELRDLERRILEQDTSLDLEAVSSIRRASVMVADIADPGSLSRISTDERAALIDSQTAAIESTANQHDGEVFANSGTAVYVLFPDASSAASAASDIQHRLDGIESEGHRLRIAIDVGDVETGDTVTGPPVNRSAAIVSAAHGGQVLLSSGTQQEITEEAGGGWLVRSLGSLDLRGLDAPEVVHQLVIDGLPDRFPDLVTGAGPASLPMTARGLAGYELREEVGAGAFGVVHRAYQPSVGREVAIKAIRPEWANQPEFVRRFEVEAQLIARLEHPHIVPLYDYWREPDSAYLVMRWLRGGTLLDRIASRRLTIDEAHGLLADIGPALAFAHRQGVVHRDLRPSNVMFDEEGIAYLTDFGIAGDIASLGHGSVPGDVRALGALLQACIGESDEQAVTDLLTGASSDHDGFPDVRSFIAAWEEAVGAGDATSQVIGYTPTRNPYKGLAAFGELDAADFHGRDDLIEQLVTALDENDLVVAVGPSGIGKSSVVRAGLIPALRSGAIAGSNQWLITTMVPGAFPFDELAAALLRVAVKAPSDLEDVLRKDARGLGRAVTRYLPPDATLVLVVDQFEELFTLCDDEDLRIGFLDTLVAA